MTIAIRVVGVGDAFTTKYFNACLLVESQSERLLIDAPPALARALASLGNRGGDTVSLNDIDHVLITHLHGDHCGGLEQLLFWRRFVTKRKCTVYAIESVLADLWSTRLRGGMEILMDESLKTFSMSLTDYANVVPMKENAVTTIGPWEIDWRNTIHHIPTSALRIRQTMSKSQVGYSADTAFDPSLIAWLSQCDLFFHETNLGIHTPLQSLVGLDSSVKNRMRLIHYPDFHDVGNSPIASANEGDRFEV